MRSCRVLKLERAQQRLWGGLFPPPPPRVEGGPAPSRCGLTQGPPAGLGPSKFGRRAGPACDAWACPKSQLAPVCQGASRSRLAGEVTAARGRGRFGAPIHPHQSKVAEGVEALVFSSQIIGNLILYHLCVTTAHLNHIQLPSLALLKSIL